MTDDERIEKRVLVEQAGEWAVLHGPNERTACATHPECWEVWRWGWRVPAQEVDSIDAHREALFDGWPSQVLACSRCEEEEGVR